MDFPAERQKISRDTTKDNTEIQNSSNLFLKRNKNVISAIRSRSVPNESELPA